MLCFLQLDPSFRKFASEISECPALILSFIKSERLHPIDQGNLIH